MNDIKSIFSRPRNITLSELASDLEATWNRDPGTDPNVAVASWITKPSILRRVASALAEWIPGEVDRIITAGPGAIALGSALSLETGLAYCASTSDGIFGETFLGEKAVFVSVAPERIPSDISARGAHIVASYVVASETGCESNVLFCRDADGGLRINGGNNHDR